MNEEPTISLIAAMSENKVIGKNNDLPWPPIKEDFKWFQKHTKGHPIIMGRKTWQSLPKKPLPDRYNIVLTTSQYWETIDDRCDRLVCRDMHTAMFNARVADFVDKKIDTSEIFIIGGGQIYQEAIPLANKMYITIVHQTIDGDTFFPEFNESEWKETFSEPHNGFTFKIYERI